MESKIASLPQIAQLNASNLLKKLNVTPPDGRRLLDPLPHFTSPHPYSSLLGSRLQYPMLAGRAPLSPMLAGRAPLSPIDSPADAARPRLHSRRRAQTLVAPLPAAVEETPASFSPCCRCLPQPSTAAAAKAHKASCLGAAPSLLLLDAEDVDLTRRPW
jgi:hypothetical protein